MPKHFRHFTNTN